MTRQLISSLGLRPKFLTDLVGQDSIVKNLEEQLKDTIPHFYMIVGPSGSGKTTLARILANCLAKGSTTLTQEDYEGTSECPLVELIEINAADKTGVDDIRKLIENVKFRPLGGKKIKVVIFDEAHQLSASAQDCLLKDLEEPFSHVFWMFCTTNRSKIKTAIHRRACEISPAELDLEDILELLVKAAKYRRKPLKDMKPLADSLFQNGIRAPGFILQAADRYLNGYSVNESVFPGATEGKLDSVAVCRAVSAGNWKKCTELLRDVEKGDVYMLRASLLGYLKKILLGNSGTKALQMAKAIQILSKCPTEDSLLVPCFLASICEVCNLILPFVKTGYSGGSSSGSTAKPTAAGSNVTKKEDGRVVQKRKVDE